MDDAHHPPIVLAFAATLFFSAACDAPASVEAAGTAALRVLPAPFMHVPEPRRIIGEFAPQFERLLLTVLMHHADGDDTSEAPKRRTATRHRERDTQAAAHTATRKRAPSRRKTAARDG